MFRGFWNFNTWWDLFFRLITDTEEGVNVEVNNPGSYNTVSVELDMASLAVNTLIQVSWFELSSCSFLMLSALKLMVQSLRPETCTEVKMDVNGIGLLDFGEEWVSNPFASIITVLSVGVSRGYTDYHQGRAIHMADSRIH